MTEEEIIFKRGLSCEFVDELNELYNKPNGSWWGRIVDEPNLFIGFRDEYLNVYYHGNNVLKLEYVRGARKEKLKGSTHKKYLFSKTEREGELKGLFGGLPDYISSRDGVFQRKGKPIPDMPISGMNEVAGIIKNIRKHHSLVE